MANLADLTFKVGHLTGHSNSDLITATDDPVARPGTMTFITDAYGPRILRYVRAISTNLGFGRPVAYDSDGANVITTSYTANGGSTTTITVASGGQANVAGGDHQGALAFITDNNDSAGAAPEGEAGLISFNSATSFTLDAGYPLSVAAATSDTFDVVSTYQMEDCFDGDEAWTIAGISLPLDGIPAADYGWVVQEGLCMCRHTTNAITEGDPVVTGYRVVDAFGSDGQELWVGIAAAAGGSTDETNPYLPIKVKLFSHAGTGASP